MPKRSNNKKGKAQSAKQSGMNLRTQNLTKSPTAGAPPSRVMKGKQGTGLSACAQLYLKAIVNPFGEFDELPCVPCAPSDMSKRVRIVHRGNFSTGTAGCGFVSWAPQCAANDVNSINSSLSTFAGTTYTVAGATVATGPKSTLPYNANAFSTAGNCIYGRLVASCMRITNTTAPLYRQGNVVANRLSTGGLLTSLTQLNAFSSLEAIRLSANRDEYLYWAHVPQDANDYEFPTSNISYIAATAGNKAAANYGFLVTGANTTNVSSFDWELVEFWEFAGTSSAITVDSLQKSHSDSVGFDRVLEAVSVPRQSLALKDIATTTSREVVEAMAHSDSAAKTVEDLLGMAGMSIGTVSSIAGSLLKMLLA